MPTYQEKYNLGWNTFQKHLVETSKELFKSHIFTDVTLVSDDLFQVKAHRTVLAGSSNFFKDMLLLERTEQPVLLLHGVQYQELIAVLEFIYLGEAKVDEDRIKQFVQTASYLDVKELKKKTEEASPAPYSGEAKVNEDRIQHTDFKKTEEATGTPTVKMETESILNINKYSKLSEHIPQDMKERIFNNINERIRDFKSNEQYQSEGDCDNLLVDDSDAGKSFPDISHEMVDNYMTGVSDNIYNNDKENSFASKEAAWAQGSQHTMQNIVSPTIIKTETDFCDVNLFDPAEDEELDTLIIEQIKQEKSMNSPNICHICQMQFTRADGLRRHIQGVHEKKVHKCTNCDKDFTTRDSMMRHIKSQHEGVNYPCPYCPSRTFGQKFHLKNHISRMHTQDKDPNGMKVNNEHIPLIKDI